MVSKYTIKPFNRTQLLTASNIITNCRFDYWEKVGKNLKLVDVSLMPQYAAWSEGYKTFGECKNAWERKYEPFDVFNHPKASRLSDEKYASLQKKKMAMELTKDTLLKIIKNRRNYNWADPFNEAIDSSMKNHVNNQE